MTYISTDISENIPFRMSSKPMESSRPVSMSDIRLDDGRPGSRCICSHAMHTWTHSEQDTSREKKFAN